MSSLAESRTDRFHDGFGGLRVLAFESRMASEIATLIRRHGGRPILAPAMREVPIEDNPEALRLGKRLLRGEIDVAIFLTGVGVRVLFRAMETAFDRAALVAALGRIFTVARGPKPKAALSKLGLEPTTVTPEPNTWRELLADVAARTDLSGKVVAVQEYGISNRDLVAGLEARGARVMAVPVYRWTMPEDRGPLRQALEKICRREAEVAIFTSSNQVINVMQTAEAAGIAARVRDGLLAMAVGSIGPVCSEQLRAHGIRVDFEPAHPRIGHLVREAARRSLGIRSGAGVATERLQIQAGGRRQVLTAEATRSPFRDHPLLKACRREATPYTPIWLMRQAGRYLPEYRRVRDRHPFLEMCRRPELSAEVTVKAVERLGVDAAIIFADILLPLDRMNVGLHYEKGDGPIIDRPIRTTKDVDRLRGFDIGELGFVGEAIKLSRPALGGKTPLIGFAGAPFTLASYLLEGGASRQYLRTKTFMYRQTAAWHRLMSMLAAVTAEYLNMQIEAGADVLQLFDSWVGSLGPDDYRRFVLPHTAAVVNAVRPGVPVIHFGTVTGNLLELMREAGSEVIGLDWRVDLGEAWDRLGRGVAVQGNLDPTALFAEVKEIRARARAILDKAAGRPGHIFNLGHGLLPETPVDHVIALVDAVHEMSRRQV